MVHPPLVVVVALDLRGNRVSITRKLARSKKKQFFKQFKKGMRVLESAVRCVSCDRVPNVISGEKIDNWHMEKKEDSIRLICPDCKGGENVDK